MREYSDLELFFKEYFNSYYDKEKQMLMDGKPLF
jgi:hypothetical protein